MSCYSNKKKKGPIPKSRLWSIEAGESSKRTGRANSKSMELSQSYFCKKLHLYRPCNCDLKLDRRIASPSKPLLPHEMRIARLLKSIYSEDFFKDKKSMFSL